MVIVHALLDHARSWDPVAEALSAERRVIAFELRGHGDSSRVRGGDYSLRRDTLDLMALIRRLDERVVIIGHSYGGQVALLAAASHPEYFDGVIFVEGTLWWALRDEGDRTTPTSLREWMRDREAITGRPRLSFDDVESAARRLRDRNARLTEAFAMHLAEHGLRWSEEGWQWKWDDQARLAGRPVELSREEVIGFARSVQCPVLELAGDEFAEKTGVTEGSDYFSQTRLVIIPDAGHSVHHDQPAAVVAAIRAFLNDLPSRDGTH